MWFVRGHAWYKLLWQREIPRWKRTYLRWMGTLSREAMLPVLFLPAQSQQGPTQNKNYSSLSTFLPSRGDYSERVRNFGSKQKVTEVIPFRKHDWKFIAMYPYTLNLTQRAHGVEIMSMRRQRLTSRIDVISTRYDVMCLLGADCEQCY